MTIAGKVPAMTASTSGDSTLLDQVERNLVEIRRLSNRCDPESIAMIGDIAKESLDAIRQKPGGDQRWRAR